MDSVNLILETLRQKQFITPLEQDILDTYHELDKKPFERDSAIRQSQKNNVIIVISQPATRYSTDYGTFEEVE